MTGIYLGAVNRVDDSKIASQKLLEVEFPFKARFKIGTQEMVIVIPKSGN